MKPDLRERERERDLKTNKKSRLSQ